jgi:hypothetical protein
MFCILPTVRPILERGSPSSDRPAAHTCPLAGVTPDPERTPAAKIADPTKRRILTPHVLM